MKKFLAVLIMLGAVLPYANLYVPGPRQDPYYDELYVQLYLEELRAERERLQQEKWNLEGEMLYRQELEEKGWYDQRN